MAEHDDLGHLARSLPDDEGDPGEGPAAPARGDALDRPRTRRRQGAGAAIGALAAAAALVFITLPQSGTGDHDTPPAPTPTPTVTPTDYVRQSAVRLISDQRSRAMDLAVAEDGTVAVVWVSHDRDLKALAMDRPDGTTYAAVPEVDLFSLTPVPGGLLALRANYYRVALLGSNGAMDPLTLATERADPTQGDVVVDLGDGPRLYSPDDATVYALPETPGDAAAGYLTPDGALVVATATDVGGPGQNAGWATLRSGRWETEVLAAGDDVYPGRVAGTGDTLVVTADHDRFGRRTLAGMALSRDGGGSWQRFRPGELPLPDVAEATVDRDGIVLLAAADGRLARITGDGEVQTPDTAPRLGHLQSMGRRTWGVGPSGRGPLWWTSDGGRTWNAEALPGLH